MTERIVKARNTLITLFHEEPKAECGHGLTAGIGIILFVMLIIAILVTKP